MVKKKKLLTITAIIILITLVIIWLINRHQTAALDQASSAFYAGVARDIPDKNNLAIAYSGFNAPADRDVFEYGRFKIDDLYTPRSSKDDEKPWPNKDYPNEITFVEWDEKQETNCEVSDEVPIYVGTCLKPALVEELLAQNSILLTRYTALYPLSDWQGPSISPHQIDFLMVNVLLGAKINLLVNQGQAEAAYALWRNNHLFLVKTLKLEIDAHKYLSFESSFLTSLNTLESFLKQAPETLIKHHDELHQLLELNGMDKYNLKGILRASYYETDRYFRANKDAQQTMDMAHLKRRLFTLHQDILSLSKISAQDLETSIKVLEKKHQYLDYKQSKFTYFFDVLFKSIHGLISPKVAATDGILGILIIPNYFTLGNPSIHTMHTNNAQLRLVKAAINIKKQKIKPSGVQAFLNKVGTSYQCPFTEGPIQYDKKTQLIYCEGLRARVNAAELTLHF